MESVFFNDLVMERIADYLPFAGIKTCRLLCSTIKEIVTPVLTKRGVTLTMTSGPSSSYRGIGSGKKVLALDPRLVQGISLNFTESEYDDDAQLELAAIHNFLDNHSQVIEQFSFCATSIYVSDFLKMMNTHDFPELREVEIAEHEVHNGKFRDELELRGAFPKLTSIKFECVPYCATPGPSHFFGVVQNFINLAGDNLGELSITYSRFPDLRNCSSVKTLEIIVPITDSESFPMKRVNKFVNEVKDTLEELRLDVWDSYQRGEIRPLPPGLELPKMPKLKVFRNRATLQYIMRRQMNPEKFPSLQIVELKDFPWKKTTNKSLAWMNTVMPQVTELSLLDFDIDFWLDDKVKYIFPNIRKCTITSAELEGAGLPEVYELVKFFKSLGGWRKLERLEIRLGSKTSVEDVLLAIGSLPVDGMLKRVKIVIMNDFEGKKLKQSMSDLHSKNLMKMRYLEMLEILGKIPRAMLTEVREFVEKWNLPVYIGDKRTND